MIHSTVFPSLLQQPTGKIPSNQIIEGTLDDLPEYSTLGVDPAAELSRLAHGFGLKLSSGARTPAKNRAVGGAKDSFHLDSMGDAGYDFSGNPASMKAFTEHLRDTYGKSLRELYHDPVGGWKDGNDIGPIGKHGDHVHVAVYPQFEGTLDDLPENEAAANTTVSTTEDTGIPTRFGDANVKRLIPKLPTIDDLNRRRAELGVMAMRQADMTVRLPGYEEAVAAFERDRLAYNESLRQQQSQQVSPTEAPQAIGGPTASLDVEGGGINVPPMDENQLYLQWNKAFKSSNLGDMGTLAQIYLEHFPRGRFAEAVKANTPQMRVMSDPRNKPEAAGAYIGVQEVEDMITAKVPEAQILQRIQDRIAAQFQLSPSDVAVLTEKYGQHPFASIVEPTGGKGVPGAKSSLGDLLRGGRSAGGQIQFKIDPALVQMIARDRQSLLDPAKGMAEAAAHGSDRIREHYFETPEQRRSDKQGWLAYLKELGPKKAQDLLRQSVYQGGQVTDDEADAAGLNRSLMPSLREILTPTLWGRSGTATGNILTEILAGGVNVAASAITYAGALMEIPGLEDIGSRAMKQAQWEGQSSGSGFGAQAWQGVGSMGAFATVPGGPAGIGIAGAFSTMGQAYQEMIDLGIPKADAKRLALLFAPAGALEAFGVTQQSIMKQMRRNGIKYLAKEVAKQLGKGGGKETLQETTQNIMQDWTAQGIYDPTRQIIDIPRLIQTGVISFLLGGVAEGAGTVVGHASEQSQLQKLALAQQQEQQSTGQLALPPAPPGIEAAGQAGPFQAGPEGVAQQPAAQSYSRPNIDAVGAGSAGMEIPAALRVQPGVQPEAVTPEPIKPAHVIWHRDTGLPLLVVGEDGTAWTVKNPRTGNTYPINKSLTEEAVDEVYLKGSGEPLAVKGQTPEGKIQAWREKGGLEEFDPAWLTQEKPEWRREFSASYRTEEAARAGAKRFTDSHSNTTTDVRLAPTGKGFQWFWKEGQTQQQGQILPEETSGVITPEAEARAEEQILPEESTALERGLSENEAERQMIADAQDKVRQGFMLTKQEAEVMLQQGLTVPKYAQPEQAVVAKETVSPTQRISREAHRKAVEEAISKGQEVSDEALEEYPDLRKEVERRAESGERTKTPAQKQQERSEQLAQARRMVEGLPVGAKLVGWTKTERNYWLQGDKVHHGTVIAEYYVDAQERRQRDEQAASAKTTEESVTQSAGASSTEGQGQRTTEAAISVEAQDVARRKILPEETQQPRVLRKGTRPREAADILREKHGTDISVEKLPDVRRDMQAVKMTAKRQQEVFKAMGTEFKDPVQMVGTMRGIDAETGKQSKATLKYRQAGKDVDYTVIGRFPGGEKLLVLTPDAETRIIQSPYGETGNTRIKGGADKAEIGKVPEIDWTEVGLKSDIHPTAADVRRVNPNARTLADLSDVELKKHFPQVWQNIRSAEGYIGKQAAKEAVSQGAQEEGILPEETGIEEPEMVARSRARLRQKLSGNTLSANPVEAFYDTAVTVGWDVYKATKEGTERFKEWSEDMIKRLGENVRPHLENVWDTLTKPAPIWFSPLERQIKLKMSNKMPAVELRRMLGEAGYSQKELDAMTPSERKKIKPGLGRDELEWTNTNEFLKQKANAGEPITKKEMLEHLARPENQIQIQDVWHGGESGVKWEDQDQHLVSARDNARTALVRFMSDKYGRSFDSERDPDIWSQSRDLREEDIDPVDLEELNRLMREDEYSQNDLAEAHAAPGRVIRKATSPDGRTLYVVPASEVDYSGYSVMDRLPIDPPRSTDLKLVSEADVGEFPDYIRNQVGSSWWYRDTGSGQPIRIAGTNISKEEAIRVEWARLNKTHVVDTARNIEQATGIVERRLGAQKEVRYAGSYVTLGGSNQRELLLTLPALPDEYKQGGQMNTSNYNSPHWDEPNPLAHVRMNDREIPIESIKEQYPELYARLKAEGKTTAKGLHLEELQSDIHQEGRKRGYALSNKEFEEQNEALRARQERVDTEAEAANKDQDEAYIQARKLADETNQTGPQITIRDRDDNILYQGNDKKEGFLVLRANKQSMGAYEDYESLPKYPAEHAEWTRKYQDAHRREREAVGEIDQIRNERAALARQLKGTPRMPLQKSWQDAAFKRMLREASEKGYDLVTWSTGAEQFKRWGSPRVDWARTDFKAISRREYNKEKGLDAPRSGRLSSEGYLQQEDGWITTTSDGRQTGPDDMTQKQAEQYVKDNPRWKVLAKEQVGGHAGDIDIELEALRQNILKSNHGTVETKADLRQDLEEVMNREKDEYSPENWKKHIDAMTERVWTRMQSEDVGTYMPRKEGLEKEYDRDLRKIAESHGKRYGAKVGTVGLSGTMEPTRENLLKAGDVPVTILHTEEHHVEHFGSRSENLIHGTSSEAEQYGEEHGYVPTSVRAVRDSWNPVEEPTSKEQFKYIVKNVETGEVYGRTNDYDKAVDIANDARLPKLPVHSIDISSRMRDSVIRAGQSPFSQQEGEPSAVTDSLVRLQEQMAAKKRNPPKAKLQEASSGRITDTSEFRRRITDSKVVDEAGRPKRVYHGTTEGESIAQTGFDIDRADTEARYGPGFYFTENSQQAGETRGQVPTSIFPVYLEIKRPLDMQGIYNREDIVSILQSLKPQERERIVIELPEKITGQSLRERLTTVRNPEGWPDQSYATERLKAAGFDGITSKRPSGRVWVAFDNRQIIPAYDPKVQSLADLNPKELSQFSEAAAQVEQVKQALGDKAGTEAVRHGSTEILPEESVSGLIIEKLQESDIPEVIRVGAASFPDHASDFEGLVRSGLDNDFSRSYVAKIDGKIVGGYLLGTHQLSDWGMRETESYSGKRGIEGVALFALPEYRGRGIGRALRDIPLSLDVDYVWGQHFDDLDNLKQWTDFGRKHVLTQEGVHVTAQDVSALRQDATKEPDFVAKSRARLRDHLNGGTLSINPIHTLYDTAVVTGWDIYKGAKEFKEWAKQMVERLGDRARPYLEDVWAKMNGQAPQWYSPLENAIKLKMPNKASVDQVKGILRGGGFILKGEGGIEIPNDEAHWTGLYQFLQSKGSKGEQVTKQDVLDHLATNRIELTERQFSDEAAKKENAKYKIKRKGMGYIVTDATGTREYSSSFTSRQAAQDWIEDWLFAQKESAPKFTEHVTPGGTNQREFTLSLKAQPKPDTREFKLKQGYKLVRIKDLLSDSEKEELPYGRMNTWLIIEPDGTPMDFPLDGRLSPSDALRQWVAEAEDIGAGDNAREIAIEGERHQSGDGGSYRVSSAHAYGIPEADINRIAIIRTNDRIGPNGEKILHVDEYQDDLQNQIQATKKEISEIEKALSIASPDESVVDVYGLPFRGQLRRKITSHQVELKRLESLLPFRGKSHELAFKRVLDYAIKNGYDKISWATGQQVADRYDLSKHIAEINYEAQPDGNYFIRALGISGNNEVLNDYFAAGNLEAVVGKELANKIIAGEGTTGASQWMLQTNGKGNGPIFLTKVEAERALPQMRGNTKIIEVRSGMKAFRGLDLKVGGEGKLHLYDTMIPNFVSKYTKRWGGKIREVDIGVKQFEAHEYTGPIYTLADAEKILKEKITTLPRIDQGVMTEQSSEFLKDLRRGISFKQAIQMQSVAFGRLLGGEITDIKSAQMVHGLTITPEMRDAITKTGQPLFGISEGEPPLVVDARARLAESMSGRKLSMNPIGSIVDLGIVEGYNIYKRLGIQKFAGWSNQMVKRLGEHIRPHLESIWERLKLSMNINTPGQEGFIKNPFGKSVPDEVLEKAQEFFDRGGGNLETFKSYMKINLGDKYTPAVEKNIFRIFQDARRVSDSSGRTPKGATTDFDIDIEIPVGNERRDDSTKGARVKPGPQSYQEGTLGPEEYQVQMEPETFKQWWYGTSKLQKTTDVANVPRTVMASTDLSAPFRQGDIFALTEPVQGLAKPFKDMLRAVVASREKMTQMQQEFRQHPYFQKAVNSGIEFTGKGLGRHEEAFMSWLADKIPWIRLSEQAYTTFLNSQRLNVFAKYAKEMESGQSFLQSVTKSAGTKTKADFDADPAPYYSIARWINAATGRGDLGNINEAYKDLASTALFSPRYIKSRIEILNLKEYYDMNPMARKIASRKMFEFMGVVATTLGLAAAAGAKVTLNPDDPDFGKIVIGNMHYDITAGLGSYIRNGILIGRDFAQGKFQSAAKRTLHFGRGKLAPVPGSLVNLYTGKNFIGEPVTLGKEVLGMSVPMVTKDLYEGWKDSGMMGLVKTAPSFFGMSVSTYPARGTRAPKGQAEQKLYDKFRQQYGEPLSGEVKERVDAENAVADLFRQNKTNEAEELSAQYEEKGVFPEGKKDKLGHFQPDAITRRRIEDKADLTPLQYMIKHNQRIDVEAALDAFLDEQATESERQEIAPILLDKIDSFDKAVEGGRIPKKKSDRVDEKIDKAVKLGIWKTLMPKASGQ